MFVNALRMVNMAAAEVREIFCELAETDRAIRQFIECASSGDVVLLCKAETTRTVPRSVHIFINKPRSTRENEYGCQFCSLQ